MGEHILFMYPLAFWYYTTKVHVCKGEFLFLVYRKLFILLPEYPTAARSAKSGKRAAALNFLLNFYRADCNVISVVCYNADFAVAFSYGSYNALGIDLCNLAVR